LPWQSLIKVRLQEKVAQWQPLCPAVLAVAGPGPGAGARDQKQEQQGPRGRAIERYPGFMSQPCQGKAKAL